MRLSEFWHTLSENWPAKMEQGHKVLAGRFSPDSTLKRRLGRVWLHDNRRRRLCFWIQDFGLVSPKTIRSLPSGMTAQDTINTLVVLARTQGVQPQRRYPAHPEMHGQHKYARQEIDFYLFEEEIVRFW